jgi:SAM-dependent methyltransferase
MNNPEQLLREANIILLVDWPDPGVPRALLNAGFKVFGSGPAGYKVAELTIDSPRDAGQHSVFPSEDLTDARYLVFRKLTGAIPSIDIVNVYRPEGEIAGIVANQVEKLGAKTLWLHPPMVSDLARRMATERGLNFVEGIDICKIARRLRKDKNHWENIYRTKQPGEVSWTQQTPVTSLAFIHDFGLPKTAKIIDIGGGDSRLVDFLLDEGFEDITVLDISGQALDRARLRLGSRADRVTWVEQDITEYRPVATFDLWHDRAAFHFLTKGRQITTYLSIARDSVKAGGYAVVGTFSDQGPDRCSGLPVRRYDERLLTEELSRGFNKIRCVTEDHITPFQTIQHFLFCSFKRSRETTPAMVRNDARTSQ